MLQFFPLCMLALLEACKDHIPYATYSISTLPTFKWFIRLQNFSYSLHGNRLTDMTLKQSTLYSDSLLWGSKPSGVKFSVPTQTGPGAYSAFSTMGTRSLCQGYSGQGMALTIHPHLALRLKKESSYNSMPPLDLHRLL